MALRPRTQWPNPSREALTKNVRGSLVFLDSHMSSTRWDVKHLKVAFGMCSKAFGRKQGREEKKTKTIARVSKRQEEVAPLAEKVHP